MASTKTAGFAHIDRPTPNVWYFLTLVPMPLQTPETFVDVLIIGVPHRPPLRRCIQHPPGSPMPPPQVKHLLAHSIGSKSRFLPRSLVTRAIDEVDWESSSSRVVNGAPSALGNTTDRKAYKNDRRTPPPPRSRWNPDTLLDRIHLYPNAPREDTTVAFDHEAIGKFSPLISFDRKSLF
ncbi:hypothetical protein EDD15DRAFT_2368622 [Pisolithus albus]|nr:hypothetical protein EDD15DRAFT_2368622 [Pisolithus albus]